LRRDEWKDDRLMAHEPDDFGQTSSRPSFGARSRRGRASGIEPGSLLSPTQRSRSARNPLVVVGHGIISFPFLAAILVGAGTYFGLREFEERGPLAQEKAVLIPRGSGTGDIGEILQNAGVIESAFIFANVTRVLDTSDDLKAGEYLFKPGVSMREVMDTLVEGKGIQHALTIPEGWTSEMIVQRLAQDEVLIGETPAVPREGSLLPDTYKYQRGTTRAQLLARMEAEQKEALEQVWKNRNPSLPLKSPAELVVLASIVEKETGKADERPRVASVFVNRLQKNMRLQSDPTVIYGIVGGKGKLDRPILKSDLEQQTPFNTYLNAGLPPAPIANPGRAAMEAVANPSQTGDLYFVADGSGGHAFAETLEQHNRNVARWRQVEKQRAAAPADAAGGEGAADQVDATATGETPRPGKKTTFVDPVANTERDPLLNKTFDLNSPQVVPKVD
jgi:UPF0755 protein